MAHLQSQIERYNSTYTVEFTADSVKIRHSAEGYLEVFGSRAEKLCAAIARSPEPAAVVDEYWNEWPDSLKYGDPE